MVYPLLSLLLPHVSSNSFIRCWCTVTRTQNQNEYASAPSQMSKPILSIAFAIFYHPQSKIHKYIHIWFNSEEFQLCKTNTNTLIKTEKNSLNQAEENKNILNLQRALLLI